MGEKRDKIEELLGQLTLEEKIGMIHGDGLFRTKGVERLGIPPLRMSDGPMGVRAEFDNARWIPAGHSDDFVTYLPCNSALAAAWNRELARECGRVLGEEARGRGKDVILAPGINIKRSPLCGRSFEYMSEDPYLAGELALPFIQGIQEADTAACVKHFALNNQESERLDVDVQVDEKTLREIYLPAFRKAAGEGGAYSLMGAYNRFHGVHCCENRELLDNILRNEWGYDGVVISDWGAVHHTREAAENSLDIEMSVTDNFEEYYMAAPLKKAVENGEIDEIAIDRKVRRILLLMERLHMLGDVPRKGGCYNTPEHRRTVLEAARESVILLKNEENRLPLQPERIKRLLVIGDNAVRAHSNGGGSAEIKALYEITPLMGIKKLLGGNVQVDWTPGYYADDCEDDGRYGTEAGVNWQADSLREEAACRDVREGAKDSGEREVPGGEELARRQARLRERAAALAASYEEVIFVGGLNHKQDTEGQDRRDMKLPYRQEEVIREVLKANPETVVVLTGGAPVEMGDFLPKTKALVWGWYGGMEGGTALAEVIFGRTNPSGRLPESFPLRSEDCPSHSLGEFPGGKAVSYGEGLYVGYRYYQTHGVPVQFPFGFGLSYTEFSMGEPKVRVAVPDGDGLRLEIAEKVCNTGKMAGKEVVQLYVGRLSARDKRPERELKGFAKIALKPGESGTVNFVLSREDFACYDEERGEFTVEPGEYRILVGRSVQEICGEATVRLGSSEV